MLVKKTTFVTPYREEKVARWLTASGTLGTVSSLFWGRHPQEILAAGAVPCLEN